MKAVPKETQKEVSSSGSESKEMEGDVAEEIVRVVASGRGEAKNPLSNKKDNASGRRSRSGLHHFGRWRRGCGITANSSPEPSQTAFLKGTNYRQPAKTERAVQTMVPDEGADKVVKKELNRIIVIHF